MEAPNDGESRPKREFVILKKNDHQQSQITPTMAETFHPFPDLPKELRLKIWEQAMVEARPNRRILIYRRRVVPFKQFISPLLLVNYESRTCAKAFYNVKLDIYAVHPVTQDQVKHLNKQKNWGRIKGSERAVDGKIHGYTDKAVKARFKALRRQIDDDGDLNPWWEEPRTEEEKIHEIKRIDRWEAEYKIDLEDHWSDFVRDELRNIGASSIRAAETSGPTTGAFYISPEHDVFLIDYDCRLHFSIDSASRILGADFPDIRHISCNHVSEKLSAATCQRVSTLVTVRLDHMQHWIGRLPGDKHCVFTSHNFVNLSGKRSRFDQYEGKGWRLYCETRYQTIFPNVRTHFIWNYWNIGESKHGFLKKLTEINDVEFSKGVVELWEMEEFETSDRFVYAVKRRHNTERAEWVRDLMAHWDISK